MAAKQQNCEPFVVVILGCTGTGKSKLAIEIAQSIDGEIISADSMQVYKGLDIITNKVSQEEQAMVPHHMINVVEANEKFSVVEFKNMALPVIRDILKRQKVPIVVGGTNYYIESLLWENLIKTRQTNDSCSIQVSEMEVEHDILEHVSEHANEEHANLEHKHSDQEHSEHEHRKRTNENHGNIQHEHSKNANDEHRQHEFLQHENPQHLSNERKILAHENPEHELVNEYSEHENMQNENASSSLYQRLVKVDPTMARRLHPNDTRKIARSLQVYEHSGKAHSELIAEQQSQEGATNYGGPMRFRNVCILWLQCDLTALDKRLDARIEKMLEQGLVGELLEFHNSTILSDPKTTEGIFQSIGFKEFHEFLTSENHTVEKNIELFSRCVDSMKVATRRYARKQIKWVTNRFLGRPSTCAPDVYGLDGTDLEQWESEVLGESLSIVKALMAGEEVREECLMKRIVSDAASKHSCHICEICNDRTIIGDNNWSMHLRSKSHRHYKKKSKRK